jgi:hypothetical protein
MLEISPSFRILRNRIKIYVIDTKQQLQGNIKLLFGTAWFTADASGSNKFGQCAKLGRIFLYIDYKWTSLQIPMLGSFLKVQNQDLHNFLTFAAIILGKICFWNTFRGTLRNLRRSGDEVPKYPKIFTEGYTVPKQYTGLSHRHEIVT